jgi:hypothetical protein
MPNNAKERILEIVQQEKWGQYYHHIENAISVCNTDWQMQILKRAAELLEYQNTNAVQILATICWRSESNVFVIPFSDKRLSILFTMSERFMQKLAKLDKEKYDKWTLEPITACLELLLALIRLRKSPDEKLKRLLTPRAKITRRFLDLLDQLTKILNEKGLQLNSRLQLQLNKPKEYKNVPDLIYTLQVYLTGGTQDNTIRILGVNEN